MITLKKLKKQNQNQFKTEVTLTSFVCYNTQYSFLQKSLFPAEHLLARLQQVPRLAAQGKQYKCYNFYLRIVFVAYVYTYI